MAEKKIKQMSFGVPEPEEVATPIVHQTLRHATLSDIPELMALSEKLIVGSPMELIGYDLPKIREQLEYFIINSGVEHLVLVSYDGDKIVGVLAAYAFEPIFSNTRIACEVLWYLSPEYRKGRRGIEMMDAYEYWAKLVGCKVVQYGWMISSPQGMKPMYERRNAKLFEEVYCKVL